MREIDLSFWMPIYMRIAERLKLDIESDRKATEIMHHLMEGKKDLTEELEDLLKGEDVVVLGNGPSLNQVLEMDSVLIAADGAAHTYFEITGRVPQVIVSDLDGPPEIFNMSSIKVVHAHGDNVNKLLRYVPLLSELVATTQVEPTSRVHNFGGFTDGDRAVFLACSAGARSIKLAGFDLDVISPYDVLLGKDLVRKREKLKIAEEMLMLAVEAGCPLEVGELWK